MEQCRLFGERCDAPKAPDFMGKTVKDVVEEAAEQGMTVETKGRGLAACSGPGPASRCLPVAVAFRVLFHAVRTPRFSFQSIAR